MIGERTTGKSEDNENGQKPHLARRAIPSQTRLPSERYRRAMDHGCRRLGASPWIDLGHAIGEWEPYDHSLE
jgi:hypothetical protein